MSQDAALLELLRQLKQQDYNFTTVTPATHARVLARPWSGMPDVRDIFGWNRPFTLDAIAPELLRLLEKADVVEANGGELRSKVRVASIDGELFVHSAFPTDSNVSVFFGPDTYRYARFLKEELPQVTQAPATIVDMGAGSGAGAILAARLLPSAKITLVDINPNALRLARINAEAAGVDVSFAESSEVPPADLVIANPPYMIDAAKRAYRDGGDLFGGAVALDWARQALANGSTTLLYTGAAVVSGRMPLIDALRESPAQIELQEIDPDVFGEELDEPAYADVQRIAVIGVVIRP